MSLYLVVVGDVVLSREMVWVPAGSFLVGSEGFYEEEVPVRRMDVPGVWVDEHPVTNKAFATFVERTGYVSTAERPDQHPTTPPRRSSSTARPATVVALVRCASAPTMTAMIRTRASGEKWWAAEFPIPGLVVSKTGSCGDGPATFVHVVMMSGT